MPGNLSEGEHPQMPDIYDFPEYYEIAFSWRDIPAEVNLFEQCFKRFSKTPVRAVLEIGSGNSPHMEELVRRGYEYNGLDLSQAMIEYSREKAHRIDAEINLIKADMVEFSLGRKVDFAYTLLGSLFTSNTRELISHFNSVAEVLRKGGLYLLDWCIQFEPPWETKGGSSWDMERDGIKVKTTVTWKPISLSRQIFEETMVFEVDDHGEKQEISGKHIHRAVYPQEFLRFIESLDEFEFVGWWNNWNLDEPLEYAKKIDRPIALIWRI